MKGKHTNYKEKNKVWMNPTGRKELSITWKLCVLGNILLQNYFVEQIPLWRANELHWCR
jgi:hypothetical protein